MSLPLLLLLNLVFSSMLTGLIWLVQLVHYPGFLLVGKEAGVAYQQHHTRSMSWVVVPLMLAELTLAIWLLFTPFLFQVLAYLNYASFAFLFIIWLATFLRAVPLHNRLSEHGYDINTIQKLIKINWFRTICWTFRTMALLLLILFYL